MSEQTKQTSTEQQAVMIDLHLFLEEVNLILNGLGQLPYAQVAGLVDKLKAQAVPQLPQQDVPQDTAEKK
jgi:hypothetical protein